MNNTPHMLMIGTPAYGGMVHCDVVNALLSYQRANLNFALMTIGNESLITRARNTVISEFHARSEFSHLLFLDADVQLPLEGLRRMLASGHDVIGAPVALKGRNANGSRIFNIGRTLGEDGPFYLVERVGTAALMLSRRAVDALVTDARSDGRLYTRGNAVRGVELIAQVQYDIFRVGIADDEYLSEDYWVCRELRRLGFRIHIDPTIVTRHSGTMAA